MDIWLTFLGIKPVKSAKVPEPVEVPVEESVVVTEVVEVTEPAVNLDSMTKKQLVEFADAHDIKVDGRRRKDTIKETIQIALG